MNRDGKSAYGSRLRAFKAGFVAGLEAPLRIFSFDVALDAPLTARYSASGLRRGATAAAASHIRRGFEAAKPNDARAAKVIARNLGSRGDG